VHEPVPHPDHVVLAHELVAEALVEADILGLVCLEVSKIAARVEAPAVLLHDPRPDPPPLKMGVDGERAEMDVGLVRIVLRPGREPLPDPRHRSRAESEHRREDPQPLQRRRLARAGRRHSGDAHQHSVLERRDWLLGANDAEEPANHTSVAAQATVRILSIGRNMKRVVPHPAGENADRIGNLVPVQVPDLDRALCHEGELRGRGVE
jgi:hypothetical protein